MPDPSAVKLRVELLPKGSEDLPVTHEMQINFTKLVISKLLMHSNSPVISASKKPKKKYFFSYLNSLVHKKLINELQAADQIKISNRPFSGLTYHKHQFNYPSLKISGGYQTHFKTEVKHLVLNAQGSVDLEPLTLELPLYYLADKAQINDNDAKYMIGALPEHRSASRGSKAKDFFKLQRYDFIHLMAYYKMQAKKYRHGAGMIYDLAQQSKKGPPNYKTSSVRPIDNGAARYDVRKHLVSGFYAELEGKSTFNTFNFNTDGSTPLVMDFQVVEPTVYRNVQIKVDLPIDKTEGYPLCLDAEMTQVSLDATLEFLICEKSKLSQRFIYTEKRQLRLANTMNHQEKRDHCVVFESGYFKVNTCPEDKKLHARFYRRDMNPLAINNAQKVIFYVLTPGTAYPSQAHAIPSTDRTAVCMIYREGSVHVLHRDCSINDEQLNLTQFELLP